MPKELVPVQGKGLARRIAEKGTTTVLDAAALDRGWRGVAAVSGKESERPAMYHTVCIEQFAEGLRLIATDSYRLLVSWVPADGYNGEEPHLGAEPIATAVAIDQWGRAKNLLAYLGQQAARDENDGLTALVRLGVPWQAPTSNGTELQFAGFDAQAVDIEYPEHERLQLPVFEGSFPAWRTLVDSYCPKRTPALAISQESAEIIAKATRPFGADCRVELTFCGENKPVAVAFGSVPRVRGLVMPVRWDFDTNAPSETDE